MPERRLRDLPARVTRFHAIRAYDVPIEDNDCIVCLRTFNMKDNIFDTPCRPYRLQPCNHLIGSECLKAHLQRGLASCPYCTINIATGPSPLPPWIAVLFKFQDSSLSPMQWLPDGRKMASRESPHALAEFDSLQDRLFNGVLRFAGAFKLWQYYMMWPAVCTVRVLIQLVAIRALFFAFEFLSSFFPTTSFIVQVVLGVMGIGIGPSLRLFTLAFLSRGALCLMELGREGVLEAEKLALVFLVFAVKNATGLIGLKGVMLLSCGNFVLFGAMVAWFIRMGMRRKMF